VRAFACLVKAGLPDSRLHSHGIGQLENTRVLAKASESSRAGSSAGRGDRAACGRLGHTEVRARAAVRQQSSMAQSRIVVGGLWGGRGRCGLSSWERASWLGRLLTDGQQSVAEQGNCVLRNWAHT
jgi:ribosomal protein S27AE